MTEARHTEIFAGQVWQDTDPAHSGEVTVTAVFSFLRRDYVTVTRPGSTRKMRLDRFLARFRYLREA